MSAIAEHIWESTAPSGTPLGFSEDRHVLQTAFQNAVSHFKRPVWQWDTRDADVQEVHEELNALAELEYDWDGEESLPVSQGALRTARRILDMSYQAAKSYDIAWQSPAVAPTPEGGVALTWEFAGRRLMLIIEGDSKKGVVCVIKNGRMRPARHVVPVGHAIYGVALTLSGR